MTPQDRDRLRELAGKATPEMVLVLRSDVRRLVDETDALHERVAAMTDVLRDVESKMSFGEWPESKYRIRALLTKEDR